MIKVSVIIPTYNRETLLVKAINSVLGQTYPHVELVVINDGSVDGTEQLIEKYVHHQNFIYHYQENSGRSVARNTGIKLSSGEFLMFLDSDDYLEKDAIETLIKLYNQYPQVNIFGGGYRLFEEQGGRLSELYTIGQDIINQDIILHQVKSMVLNMGNNIIRKQLIVDAGMFTQGLDYAEDWELLSKVCLNQKAVITRKLVLNVLRHNDNSSFKEIQQGVIEVSEKFVREIDEGGLSGNIALDKKLKVEWLTRIAMAYNRKGEKKHSLSYFIQVIKMNPLLLVSNAKFLQEFLYLFIPTQTLIFFREIQLKFRARFSSSST